MQRCFAQSTRCLIRGARTYSDSVPPSPPQSIVHDVAMEQMKIMCEKVNRLEQAVHDVQTDVDMICRTLSVSGIFVGIGCGISMLVH
jgi:hypothetical protein